MLLQHMHENDIATLVVDVAYKVHTVLGPGLLESVYEAAMVYEFDKRGIRYERQLPCPVPYEDVILSRDGFRMDFLVESKVIVEVKSVETVAKVVPKTVLTYLNLFRKKLAMLINFNVVLIKDGIQRIMSDLKR
ncbi:MAG TPA: GxxExxY protein [Saprospiraceae bacterium]|nr:GxxExxY protein [Saprospiraceae bacterium]